MSAHMTKAAWDRGFKNLAICSVGVVAIGGVLVFALVSILQQPIQEVVWIGFAILWFLSFGLFMAGWLYGQYASGAVLLDCGPHPTRALFAVCGLVALSMAVGGGFTVVRDLFEGSGLVGALFASTFAAYWFVLSLGRLQIREQGIWPYWGLLKWSKLKSYAWADDAESTLLVQTQTKLPFLGRGALPVPPEQRDAVDTLLRKYDPSAS